MRGDASMSVDTSRSTLREKNQLTLPQSVRETLHVEPGDEIEFEVVGEDTVLLRGLKLIPADQAWFWTESWQAGETEATNDIRAGRVKTFKDADSSSTLSDRRSSCRPSTELTPSERPRCTRRDRSRPIQVCRTRLCSGRVRA